jgi:hypothetical protein
MNGVECELLVQVRSKFSDRKIIPTSVRQSCSTAYSLLRDCAIKHDAQSPSPIINSKISDNVQISVGHKSFPETVHVLGSLLQKDLPLQTLIVEQVPRCS